MTQEQVNQQPGEQPNDGTLGALFRIGRHFVRKTPLGAGFQVCRLDGLTVTVIEERLSLSIAEIRCRQLARLDPVTHEGSDA
ncbi:MAG: hypothetical protein U0836_16215 [Pirellulales bacterium]